MIYNDRRPEGLQITFNPPFVGASNMDATQKKEAVSIYGETKLSHSIDYVGAWYHLAAKYIKGKNTQCAFVSTNSITQGEQVAPLWKPLINEYGINISFAHKTFQWDSESNEKAHVHCVIIGFQCGKINEPKLFSSDQTSIVKNISPYLVDLPNVLIESRARPICDVPKMLLGNKPSDGGNLIISPQEKKEILAKEPTLEKFIHLYVGSEEYIKKKERYCFWLTEASPKDILNSKELTKRINAVREMRERSTAKPTQEKANTPHLFFFISQPSTNYIIIPSTSSMNRRYIPMGFLPPEVIVSNAATIIPNATLYHFGVLESNIHMAWMRVVAGRLKSDYRYSNSIVYNTFPWPTPSDSQLAAIENTAQAILDARAKYSDSNLSKLYSPTGMRVASDLLKAHQANDKAVMQAYGFWGKFTSQNKEENEAACVAELMKMYEKLVEGDS